MTKVVISIAAQLEPLSRPDGEDFGGDLDAFAKSMCAYVAKNLERFADERGGDTFVAVSLVRGDEKAAHQFRSGHYVKPESEGGPSSEGEDG